MIIEKMEMHKFTLTVRPILIWDYFLNVSIGMVHKVCSLSVKAKIPLRTGEVARICYVGIRGRKGLLCEGLEI